MKIQTDTIVRTIVLAVALINQVLTAFGRPILPIEEALVSQLITAAFTIGASIWAFWKNNSFTTRALTADAVKNLMKAGEVTPTNVQNILEVLKDQKSTHQ